MKTILVVDDERDIREAFKEALESEGDYRVITAKDGSDALRLVAEGLKPDLILLDLMMGGMDGETFMHQRRAVPQLDKVPVLVVSASGSTELKTAQVKADGWLKKPLDLDFLLKSIQERVNRIDA